MKALLSTSEERKRMPSAPCEEHPELLFFFLQGGRLLCSSSAKRLSNNNCSRGSSARDIHTDRHKVASFHRGSQTTVCDRGVLTQTHDTSGNDTSVASPKFGKGRRKTWLLENSLATTPIIFLLTQKRDEAQSKSTKAKIGSFGLEWRPPYVVL